MSSPLVRAAVRGDPDARQALVQAHGRSVYGLCRRLAVDPDDAYQSVWERVFRALPGFDPDGAAPFARWLSVVTRRHLVDRHRRLVVRGPPQPVDDLPQGGPSVDEQLDERLRRERLARAVAELPEAQRAVVVAHHLEGLALTDLAAREGVAVGTIKSRLHRGRAALAVALRRVP